jgi:hypothetical protein
MFFVDDFCDDEWIIFGGKANNIRAVRKLFNFTIYLQNQPKRVLGV